MFVQRSILIAMNSMVLLYLVLLFRFSVCNAEEERKEVHFYCRVCGSLIANYSSVVKKEALHVDEHKQLENQEGNLRIEYDSFGSSVCF